jgi:hypothetical protein
LTAIITIIKNQSVQFLNLIFGLLIIGIGFIVKAFPNSIAGYNTMSKEQKKNVDIEAASTFIRNGFIIIGLIIIVGYYILKWIGLDVIANNIIPISVFIGLSIIVIIAQKFDHNKRKKT